MQVAKNMGGYITIHQFKQTFNLNVKMLKVFEHKVSTFSLRIYLGIMISLGTPRGNIFLCEQGKILLI